MNDRSSNPLTRALARCRTALGAVASISLAYNVLVLVVSLYSLQVFDRVLSSGSTDTLLFLTLVAVGGIAVMGLLDLLRARILVRTSVWLDNALSAAAIARSLRLVRDGQRNAGSALRQLNELRIFLGGAGVLALLDLPWAPVFLAVLYLLDPAFGHLTLATMVLLLGLGFLSGRHSRAGLGAVSRMATANQRRLEACLDCADAVDAMAMGPGVIRRWHNTHQEVLAGQTQASDAVGLMAALARGARLLAQVGAVGIGAHLVLAGEVSTGIIIAAQMLLGRALAPAEQAVGAWRQTAAAREAYGNLHALFAAAPDEAERIALPAPQGHLKVAGLHYRPAGAEVDLLRDISFDVLPGEAIGILGASGAGKSTLARLLVGVGQPAGGSLRLDGAELTDWDRTQLGRHLGYLPQDVQLLPGTVRDNIARLGGASDEEVVAAAKLAGVHELILRLPGGYGMPLAERGAPLSGGQRQLVGLARALLGDPRLVVLDEPNASLDPQGEAILARAVAALKARGTAVVIIGHRPATFIQVDKFLLLRNGAVEAYAPREQFLAHMNRTPQRPAVAAAS